MAVALSLTASAALAQQTADPEVLIRDGVTLRKQGEDAKAHGYFQRAYDVAPTPRTAAQLGLCDLAVGRWLDAEVHLGEALDSRDPWVNNQRAALEQGRAKARAKLGRIVITGAAPGTTVTATGRPPTKLPDTGQIWGAPGSMHLRLEAPGYRSVEQDVGVSEDKRTTVEVMMPPLQKEAPPRLEQGDDSARAVAEPLATPAYATSPPESPPRGTARPRRTDSGSWHAPVIWTAAGLSAAMLVFGIYETMEYNSRVEAFNDLGRTIRCGDSGGTIAGGADCERLAREGDRAKALAIVSYVGAGVLGATAIIVALATAGSRADVDVASSGLSCSPAQGNGMQAGLNCALRF